MEALDRRWGEEMEREDDDDDENYPAGTKPSAEATS
jgi:hypothetical protein